MKLLWVEDFGGGMPRAQVVIEIFKYVLSQEVFDDEYDPDEDVTVELPRLFEKHTKHQIIICRSYVEWKEVYEQHGKNFDTALLDLNLTDHRKTLPEEMPDGIDNPKFDEFAGFYIYHQLIKDGFSEDNIAILTGYQNSLNFLIKRCNEILLPKPRYAFEKTSVGFKKLREDWLDEVVGV